MHQKLLYRTSVPVIDDSGTPRRRHRQCRGRELCAMRPGTHRSFAPRGRASTLALDGLACARRCRSALAHTEAPEGERDARHGGREHLRSCDAVGCQGGGPTRSECGRRLLARELTSCASSLLNTTRRSARGGTSTLPPRHGPLPLKTRSSPPCAADHSDCCGVCCWVEHREREGGRERNHVLS